MDEESILITGASGFLGRRACALLDGETKVHALIRPSGLFTSQEFAPNITVHESDGSVASLIDVVRLANPTMVLHLASHYRRLDETESIPAMIESNIGFGTRLLEAISTMVVAPVLVLVGSQFQDYELRGRALNLYAATKSAFQIIAEYYRDAHGVKYCTAVLYDIYGPNDTRPKLVNIAVGAALAGREIQIPDDETSMYLIYVDDAVRALRAAGLGVSRGTVQSGDTMYVTADELVSVRDLIRTVEHATGQAVAISADPYNSPPRRLTIPMKGTRPPGWHPQISLRDGIRSILKTAK